MWYQLKDVMTNPRVYFTQNCLKEANTMFLKDYSHGICHKLVITPELKKNTCICYLLHVNFYMHMYSVLN